MVCVSIQLTPPPLPPHSSLSVFTSVFCFLKESTLLASGPVAHAFPFLSLSTFPRLPVSTVSHYNAVVLLEEPCYGFSSSTFISEFTCCGSSASHPLACYFCCCHLSFLLWSSHCLHYHRCLSGCILLQSGKRDRHNKRTPNLVSLFSQLKLSIVASFMQQGRFDKVYIYSKITFLLSSRPLISFSSAHS